MANPADDLTPEIRAEDIILGSLGFGQDARIVSLEQTEDGYKGVGRWPDGERFTFQSDDELDDLQRWALGVLIK